MSADKDARVEVDPVTGQRYIWINGVRAVVGTEAQCEAADFVVCGPVSFFADDVRTICAFCAAGIVHRPLRAEAATEDLRIVRPIPHHQAQGVVT